MPDKLVVLPRKLLNVNSKTVPELGGRAVVGVRCQRETRGGWGGREQGCAGLEEGVEEGTRVYHPS